MDELDQAVYEAVATPPSEDQQQPEKIEQSVVDEREETNQRNWREIRRKNRELEEKLKMQEEMMARVLTAPVVPQTPPVPDEFDSIGDEEFIPAGKIKKFVQQKAQKIAEEIAAKETEKAFAKHEESRFMDRLKSQYSDFSEVVNPETMSILEEQHPELAKIIVGIKDPYKIGVQAYEFIKAKGITDKVPQSRRAKDAEKKIEANAKTVQSPTVYDKRPMAQAFNMTDSEKSALAKEMYHYAGQAGFSY